MDIIRRKIIVLLIFLFIVSGCASVGNNTYQNDADLIRLEHLAYWSGLIEEYNSKNNSYPLARRVLSEDNPVLVKIATQQQTEQLASFMNQFDSASMAEFVTELELGLGRDIDEKYDIQKVPVKSPVGYFYFATTDGYVLWVTCITCGVTKVSTLLMDGITPTVNIVSASMSGKVTKALTREKMLNNPTYRSWLSRSFYKEEYVRGLVKINHKDSEKI
jgi:hypothetical protein